MTNSDPRLSAATEGEHMKIWFDTEFIEDGSTIELISIGLVREDGATYYAETDQYRPALASQWVKDNVLVHLQGGEAIKPRDVIAREIVEFAGWKPEFWAYYADYDWVALCQLFGTMMQLPEGWPMFCRDVKQLCVDRGDPKLPKQDSTEHHALADAVWTKQAWEFLHSFPVAQAERKPDAWQLFDKGRWLLLPADWEESENIPGRTYRPLYSAPAQPPAAPVETDAMEGELDTVVQLIHKHVDIRDLFDGAQELTGVEPAAKAILAALHPRSSAGNVELLIENLIQSAVEYENNCDRLVAKTIRVELEKAKQAIRDALTLAQPQTLGVREATIDECAQIVEPKGFRPCDCERCYCGNHGDREAVASWDADAANAKAIRALALTRPQHSRGES